MTGETRDDGTQDSTVIVCNLCSEVILTLEGAYYDYPPEKIKHTCHFSEELIRKLRDIGQGVDFKVKRIDLLE